MLHSVLCAASGSEGAYFICISLLLLFSVIMCCVISAATAPRKRSSSSRVNALKQMWFMPQVQWGRTVCSHQLLSPGWAAILPSLCSLSMHQRSLSAQMGSQLKMDQKACQKSCILSHFLVYVSSSLCRVFLKLKTVFLSEHQLSHQLQWAALI